ncbi:hypothetical protein IE81DRAFT_313715 [Ceraceosorus guamensis]|uniref:PRB1-protease B, vacuolar n=1 Tax=Ceraceosorus guamensis TaxID=1522189 RepID=A0A316W1C9_9BASI|nr:hypothetical protein IE81DRAFT_313715 [Ceraceosorus guamensis]PWN42371.1 hypothetical protein IE81DRAFT_313715 [Ceraceosorus guamensis]
MVRVLPLALALTGAIGAAAAPAATTSIPAFVPGQMVYTGFEPAQVVSHPTRQPIKNNYMVVLKDGVSESSLNMHTSSVQQAQAASFSSLSSEGHAPGVRHVYHLDGQFSGYAGAFSDDVLAYIRAHPDVAYVEEDTVVSTQEMPHNGDHVWDVPYESTIEQAYAMAGAPELSPMAVEKGSPWGLVRVSHRQAISFPIFGQYVYNSHGGEGVTAYIVDTGINTKHVEFEGRARWGKTMPANDNDEDGNGHGTHCAGTVGSRKYGVAKKVELVAVKVLGSGGSGSMSDVTGGVLWAANNATAIAKEHAANPNTAAAKKHKGFVANMSLGGGKSPSLDKAVNGAVRSGLHFAVAAGNENADACNTSPAGAEDPVTVAASTFGDERAYFSNKGPCVDIAAPGLNILSTWIGSNTSVNTISGTSMATPHTVGMLAYLLSVYGTPEFYEGASTTLFDVEQASPVLRFTGLARVFDALPLPSLILEVASRLFGAEKTAVHALAPVPAIPSVIEPLKLKAALQKLATKDILTDMAGTKNLLIFNNATDATKGA